MNTRNLPLSALLVAIGAGAVLMIGAFARFDTTTPPSPAVNPSPSPATLTQDDPPPSEVVDTVSLPANLSPGLAEIIKLAQAHVEEGVILAYVKSSGQTFSPTADEILYLSDLGLSQDVIGAMVKTAPPVIAQQASSPIAASPGPMPPPTEPPSVTAPITTAGADQDLVSTPNNPFYNDLAPYGGWVQQSDYGLCWQPTVVTIDPNWTPYVDAGQWTYSDCGWFWQSDYSWGWAAFHYGRWTKVPHLGWVWVPGNQWAPAWVAWRSAGSYIGWAALPPGVSLNVLAQLTYNNKPAGRNGRLGLTSLAYTFVSAGNLIGRNLPRHAVPASQARDLARSSALVDSYAVVNNRIFNKGIDRDTVAAAAHKSVPEVALRAVSSPESAGLTRDRKTLGVYVPAVSATAASSSAQPVMNKSARMENPAQEPVMLAENKPADGEVVPAEPNSEVTSVQLPSLHYPEPSSPPAVHHHPQRNVIIASGNDAMPASRDGQPAFGRTALERPSSPAPVPRYEGFNRPPAGQGEPPRIVAETRPPAAEIRAAPVEIRAAPVEPVRVAPAPAAVSSPSSGSSKSGKG
jgi:hypothetical protein